MKRAEEVVGNGEAEVFAMEEGEARARAAVVEAARSSIGRVEKHWKVEHDVVAEDTKAKNLDFGSSADYYEAKRVQLNNSEQQEQEGEAPEEEPAMAAVDVADPTAGDDQDVWREAVDPHTNRLYYYCQARGLTQWEKPSGDVRVVAAEEDGKGEDRGGAAVGRAMPASGVPRAQGSRTWRYRDLGGQTQGPFDLHTIVSWITAMPMDVRVWCEDEGKDGRADAEAELRKWRGDPDLAAPFGEGGSITFADLAGRTDLLTRWREERGADNCLEYGIAPTVPAAEATYPEKRPAKKIKRLDRE